MDRTRTRALRLIDADIEGRPVQGRVDDRSTPPLDCKDARAPE